ncbi:MAG: iron-containing alcohol dehydrogenase [Angelakisella sp.]
MTTPAMRAASWIKPFRSSKKTGWKRSSLTVSAPTLLVWWEGRKLCRHCDAILAVGGSSVLDAAKTAAAAIANHKPAEKLVGTLR